MLVKRNFYKSLKVGTLHLTFYNENINLIYYIVVKTLKLIHKSTYSTQKENKSNYYLFI